MEIGGDDFFAGTWIDLGIKVLGCKTRDHFVVVKS